MAQQRRGSSSRKKGVTSQQNKIRNMLITKDRLLSPFRSERGKILLVSATGTSAKNQ